MGDRYDDYRRTFEIDWPEERVLRLTLNKPETYNSLDSNGHRDMTYIWRDIDQDRDVSAVILTGKGRAFSSGGDFSMIRKNIDNYDDRVRVW